MSHFRKKQTKQTQFFGFRLKTEREESIIFYTRGIENILEIEIVESLIIFLERLFIKERKKPMFFFLGLLNINDVFCCCSICRMALN